MLNKEQNVQECDATKAKCLCHCLVHKTTCISYYSRSRSWIFRQNY